MRNLPIILTTAFTWSLSACGFNAFQTGDEQVKAVQTYNVNVRTLPSNLSAMVFGYKARPNFEVDDEKAAAQPAKVDFGKTPAKPQDEAPGVPD